MLKLSLFEFIARVIPEEFLFVLAVHALSKTAIDLKKYILSGAMFSIEVYLIRLLPIQYGIHTILSLIGLIVLVSFINKIDIIKSIRAGISVFILDFILEGLNVSFAQFILKKDLNSIMSNPISKTLFGFPSVIILGIFVIGYYFRLSKRKELRHV